MNYQHNFSSAPMHVKIDKPASRAAKALGWEANALGSGKFFPEESGGLLDPFAPADMTNFEPPRDHKIASAGFKGAEVLDEYGENRWFKHEIKAGSIIEFRWVYTQTQKTRRWNYFITKDGWDPNAPLSRRQFEKKPFFCVQNNEQPFWDYLLLPLDPTIHKVKMPAKTGYHVILGVWEIADSGNGFYQVIDVQFV